MNGKKKYLVYGGWVTSINDGDSHYVSAKQVADLYGVPYNMCKFVDNNDRIRLSSVDDYIVLRPRYDGIYILK